MRPDKPRDRVAGPSTGPEPPFPIYLSGPVVQGFGRGSKEVRTYIHPPTDKYLDIVPLKAGHTDEKQQAGHPHGQHPPGRTISIPRSGDGGVLRRCSAGSGGGGAVAK